MHIVSGKRKLQRDCSTNVISVGHTFSFVEAFETFRIDLIDLAADCETFGPLNKSGIGAQIKQPIDRFRGRIANAALRFEKVVQGISLLQRPVNKNQQLTTPN